MDGALNHLKGANLMEIDYQIMQVFIEFTAVHEIEISFFNILTKDSKALQYLLKKMAES